MLAVCPSARAAGETLLSTFIWKDAGPPTMARPPVLFFQLGDFRGILEKTTLAQVQRRFGGRIVNNGRDAAEGENSLCYTLRGPGGIQSVSFGSNMEMGGGKEITGVMAVRGSGCPRPSHPVAGLSLDRGIGLGMAAMELVHTLGKPSARSGNPLHGQGRMSFSYGKPVSPRDPALVPRAAMLRKQGFSVYDALEVETLDGRVTGLSATRVTEN